MNQIVNFRPFPTSKVFTNGILDELFNRNIGDVIGSDIVAQRPAVNILETKDDFKLEVAAPGFGKGDFDIKVENNLLTISAKREQKTENTDERFTRREFRYETFTRSFNLPQTVNQNEVAAVYENGILNVTLPKKEEAKPAVKAITVG
jgi:HSP20 family protein